MEFDTASLDVAQRYKLLIGTVVPRPIALVSTVSPRGVPNLAPYSFFTGISSNPMLVGFCPANTATGDEKDTLHNARPEDQGGTGEFVVNVASETYARAVAAAGEPLPPEESEFDLTGLTPMPSRAVKPPRVAESPVCLECRTEHVLGFAPGEPAGGNLVIGRVVHVFVRDGVVNDRLHTDANALGAIGRMGGMSYCRTHDRFELPVGRAALDANDLQGGES